jgi:hypothetical protein
MNKLSIAAMQKKMHSKGVSPMMRKKLAGALASRKWKKEKGGLVEYGLGGFIGDVMQGVGDMAAFTLDNTLSGFGMGNVVGNDWYSSDKRSGQAEDVISKINPIKNMVANALVPGSGTITGELQKMNTDKTTTQIANDEVLRQNDLLQSGYKQTMSNQPGFNRPTFAKGGMISGQPNVELEKEEVSQAPDGSMQKFNLPSHANATSANQMAMEPGTRIFSDKLKAQSGKTIAEEADRLRKEIQRYEQILNS